MSAPLSDLSPTTLLTNRGRKLGHRWRWGDLFLTVSVVVVGGMFVVLVGFVLAKSYPFFAKLGFAPLTGLKWIPRSGMYGLAPLIWGTLYVAFFTLCIAFPLGVSVGVFLYDFCPVSVKRLLETVVYLLANIPPVVYGFVGIVLVLPQLRAWFGGAGYSVLAVAAMLAILTTPIIIIATYTALNAVPQEYHEGIVALGANRMAALRYVMLPIAWPGVITGALLGLGRAIGETMIVLMLSGNVVGVPLSPLSPIRTLTGNIALEMSYSTGDHRRALFVCGLVLFLLTMGIDLIVVKILLHGKRGQAATFVLQIPWGD